MSEPLIDEEAKAFHRATALMEDIRRAVHRRYGDDIPLKTVMIEVLWALAQVSGYFLSPFNNEVRRKFVKHVRTQQQAYAEADRGGQTLN